LERLIAEGFEEVAEALSIMLNEAMCLDRRRQSRCTGVRPERQNPGYGLAGDGQVDQNMIEERL